MSERAAHIPEEPTGTQPEPQPEAETIPLATLNGRIQDELMSMAMLASELQTALGPAIENAGTLSPAVLRSLQSVDRLHQTLDDLTRVFGHLKTQCVEQTIEARELDKVIQLRHLAHKLFDDTDSPFVLCEEDSGEIAWF
jgi:hypothetical protein